jgi:hypothetical protein
VLGVGGIRACGARLEPTVFHLNEGHAAFAGSSGCASGRGPRSIVRRSAEDVRRTTVFTTHTPAPAGTRPSTASRAAEPRTVERLCRVETVAAPAAAPRTRASAHTAFAPRPERCNAVSRPTPRSIAMGAPVAGAAGREGSDDYVTNGVHAHGSPRLGRWPPRASTSRRRSRTGSGRMSSNWPSSPGCIAPATRAVRLLAERTGSSLIPTR